MELAVGIDQFLLDEPGLIGWGGNSGFHAMNLALQFGATRLILVGFDMQSRRGLHWHGPHEHGLSNPDDGVLARWASVIDAQAPLMASLGVQVINTSVHSAIKAYPKMPLSDALSL